MLLKENVVIMTYDFTLLFRSTIGFDRLLDILDDNRPRSVGRLMILKRTVKTATASEWR
jgi:hypothetical protein